MPADIAVKKRYETGIWVEGASFTPRDFLLRLPAGQDGDGAAGDPRVSPGRNRDTGAMLMMS